MLTSYRIIVGVKYCFRYNARNRAPLNGQPIGLQDVQPHRPRRRRERKLLTMEEVNTQFPLTKYSVWMASRNTPGGVDASAAESMARETARSIRDEQRVVDMVPSSPTGTKMSMDRDADDKGKNGEEATDTAAPATSTSTTTAPTTNSATPATTSRQSTDITTDSSEKPSDPRILPKLEEVQTNATTGTHYDPKNPDNDAHQSDSEDEDAIQALHPDISDHPGDSCAICIDTLEADEDVRGLACGHAFHASCIDPWLTSRRASCPLCKRDYWVPKPRAEGHIEVGERRRQRRAARRAGGNITAPEQVWVVRGNRMYLPGRFLGGAPVYLRNEEYARRGPRNIREQQRALRQQEELRRREREVRRATRGDRRPWAETLMPWRERPETVDQLAEAQGRPQPRQHRSWAETLTPWRSRGQQEQPSPGQVEAGQAGEEQTQRGQLNANSAGRFA